MNYMRYTRRQLEQALENKLSELNVEKHLTPIAERSEEKIQRLQVEVKLIKLAERRLRESQPTAYAE